MMSDTRSARDVTEAELQVLRALWDGGPSAIRGLAESVYPGGGSSEYATVQKLLDRLEEKGCVARRPEGRLNVFTATVRREELVARRLRQTAEQLCDGSLTPLLTHLVSAGGLSSRELRALRQLVDRHGSSGPDPDRSRR